jgi:hypothetical protein
MAPLGGTTHFHCPILSPGESENENEAARLDLGEQWRPRSTFEERAMRRIYFLVPDIPTAKRIVDELLLARIAEQHLHVIAKRGTPLEDLPEANLLQKTDFIPALERGFALGGSVGILAGLVAIALPATAPVIAGGILLASALSGAGVGAWIGGMVGMNVGNTRLKQFEHAIEEGHLLVLADVPRDRVEQIEERVRQHLPSVEIEGTEPTIPAFP